MLEEAFSLALAAEARFTDLQLWKFLRSSPSTLGEAFFKARITEANFEDEQIATTIVSPNDLNIAIPNQSVRGSGISESGISGLLSHLRDAKDEQYRAMIDATALKAELNSLQQKVINDDLGIITSYHMQASEKELAVLKSPLDQELMFMHQEGMLRRQEQQQLAKDAKIQ
ncbi:hypothetical protein Tco_0956746 [Tanacetum coccineum]